MSAIKALRKKKSFEVTDLTVAENDMAGNGDKIHQITALYENVQDLLTIKNVNCYKERWL